MLDKPTFRWNDETVDLIKSAIANGLSAAETASALAERYRHGPTRSAILGKAHRFGLNFGHAATSSPRAASAAKRQAGFPWTPPAIEKFRELVASGLSSQEIIVAMAKVFYAAPRLSASAVQQRASMLGIAIRGGRRGPKQSAIRPPASMTAAPSRPVQDSGGCEVLPLAPAAPPFPDGGVSLLDLEFGMCRWIEGDPRSIETHRYCGAQAKPGQAYCSNHHALAYTPTSKRQRTKAQEDADDKRRAYAMQRWASGLRASGRSAGRL